MEPGLVVQFDPFVSRVDAGFWHELGKRKLDKYKLSEAEQCITGCYSNGAAFGLPTHFTVNYSAFFENKLESNTYLYHGVLLNTNTLDAFKTASKSGILNTSAVKIWEEICSDEINSDPMLLNKFYLLTFADLKKFNFYYWFAFPALRPDRPFQCESIIIIEEMFTSQQIDSISSAYEEFSNLHPGVGYFILEVEPTRFTFTHLKNFNPKKCEGKKIMLGFCDSSTMKLHPGWPLRNFLMYASKKWESMFSTIDVLCYRSFTKDGRRQNLHSLIIKNLKLLSLSEYSPLAVGWERNDKNKLSPKVVNLSSSMDPVRLSESSVDLNLKLMRWRSLPTLDLQTISQTRCLLLGAGTLGCNVARCLLGWGVRNITLVDSGFVSYSNPVRQSLFTFKNCENGGAPKAITAAESLKTIFPGVNSVGISLSIPMPGHSVTSHENQVVKDVEKLEELIHSNDVVFLLMDTRESRWLPTLFCAAYSKLCINAALGFDTYMVMRHGFRSKQNVQDNIEDKRKIVGSNLSCYFCSDVVAPTNSTRDRTLDQQCTVSRPGISMIAGALAVELLMSILQHPDKGLASSENLTDDDETECESSLGLVPHQIRGFMSRYHHVLPASRKFDKCTACSDIILKEYQKQGVQFLLKAFNSSTYLEDLTGLSELHVETFDEQVWEYSDDESF